MHPCATCGQPLRWIVEANAWGCDRCRTYAPRRTSRAWIAVLAVAMIGGAVAIAAVLAKRSSDKPAAPAAPKVSRDDAIAAAFTAMSKGDVDALLELSFDPTTLAAHFECRDKKPPATDADAVHARMRADFATLVQRVARRPIRVLRVITKPLPPWTDEDRRCDNEDDKILARKGCEDDGCVSRVDARVQTVSVAIELDGTALGVELHMLELDGGYYLMQVPTLADPQAKPVATTYANPDDEYLAHYAEVTDKICACPTMDCATQRNLEFARWVMSFVGDDLSRANFGPETTEKKKVIEQRNSDCLVKLAKAARDNPPPPADPSALPPAPADMPKACAALRDVVVELLACKGSNPQAHGSYTMMWTQMVSSWSRVTDDATRDSYVESCDQLVAGVRTAAGYMCKP